jgi:feruloyl esterase
MKRALVVVTGLLVSSAAFARPACTPEALNALRLPGLSVIAAAPVAATADTPSHCAVQAVAITQGEGAPDGSARVGLQLPVVWKQRFFFMGVGGNGGSLTPAVNTTDRLSALGKGYVTAVTDTGHAGNGTDAGWVRTPDGKRDEAKIADFFYRAAHVATLAGKALAKAYYAEPVQHAYFDGCSTGGRMAMMEAERYPTDFDGIIAGDPNMDYHATLQRFLVQKAAFASAAAFLSPDTLAIVDKTVTERCDLLDGVKDGLVQDPARCRMRAEDLACKPGIAADCLTPDQVTVLRAYTTPLKDRHAHVVFPGWAMTNLTGARGMSYWTTGATAPDLTHIDAPWGDNPVAAPRGWVFARQALTSWLGMGAATTFAGLDADPRTNTVGDALIALADRTFAPAETKNPAKLLPFIQQGRKLILYHGTSDPALPAARTVQFYQELSTLLHGRDKAAANVRLFLVPGMQHCSGGIGPDQFDTLSALEAWAEQGKAPEVIPARTKADTTIAPHELPLCPYPRQARFSGFGQANDAANWKCAEPVGKG